MRQLIHAGAQCPLDLTDALRVCGNRQVVPVRLSQMAVSSASVGVGPASAFSDTLIAVAPRRRQV